MNSLKEQNFDRSFQEVWAVESISGRCRKGQRQVWVPEVTSFAKAELS